MALSVTMYVREVSVAKDKISYIALLASSWVLYAKYSIENALVHKDYNITFSE